MANTTTSFNVSRPRLFVTATLETSFDSKSFKALVDSGSDVSFMNTEVMTTLQSSPCTLPQPMIMETIDGTPLTSGSPKHYLDAQVIVNNCSTPIRLLGIGSRIQYYLDNNIYSRRKQDNK